MASKLKVNDATKPALIIHYINNEPLILLKNTIYNMLVTVLRSDTQTVGRRGNSRALP